MNGLDAKILRIRAGVKQYQLAAALGITQTTLSLIENGRKELTPGWEHRIREALTSLGNSEAHHLEPDV